MILRDVVARWPGASHDAFIWRFSELKGWMDRGDFADVSKKILSFDILPLQLHYY
jgi:hypothetical protein